MVGVWDLLHSKGHVFDCVYSRLPINTIFFMGSCLIAKFGYLIVQCLTNILYAASRKNASVFLVALPPSIALKVLISLNSLKTFYK